MKESTNNHSTRAELLTEVAHVFQRGLKFLSGEVNKIGNHSASLNKPLRQSKKLTDFFGKAETLGSLRQKSEPVDDCRIKSDSHTADKSGIPTDKLTAS